MPRNRRGRINGSKKGNRIPAAREKLEALKSKSLYICFAQRHNSPRFERWVALRIQMSDVLSASESKLGSVSFEKFADEIDFGGEPLPFLVGCGVFKSKILLGGGLEAKLEELPLPPSSRMYSFETVISGPKLKMESFPDLIGGTSGPLLFEIQGTLYALNGNLKKVIFTDPPHFERFEPSDMVWKPLPRAPIWDRYSPYYKGPVGTSFVIAGTSILLSRPDHTPVFQFDIKAPDAGWSVQKSLCSGKSFPFKEKTLVQDCPPHAGGGGFIIFAIDIEAPRMVDELEVLPITFPKMPVYLMSKDYDSLNLLETVELPFQDALPSSFCYPCGYSFLDLGDQRVGLVLAAFTQSEDSDSEKMEFLVTTFKYELSISQDSPSPCSFKYQCLSDPVILEYSMERPSTVFVKMLGVVNLAR